MSAWHVTAIEELEWSSRDADELFSVAELSIESELSIVSESSIASELSAPLLSEEISSFSCPLVLFALLLSSQAASIKVNAAATNPQAIFARFCFMSSLLLKVWSRFCLCTGKYIL